MHETAFHKLSSTKLRMAYPENYHLLIGESSILVTVMQPGYLHRVRPYQVAISIG